MPKTVQVRDIDDVTYATLVRRAAEDGLTVPELLRQQIAVLASRPSMREWVERTRRRRSNVAATDVVAALDESRGPWPT